MGFVPNTPKCEKEILDALGVESFRELISNIPEKFIKKAGIELPQPLSEAEVSKKLTELSQENRNTAENVSFLGGGSYDHFIPATVDFLLQRSEFYTAYTPYQAEVSQGTLQVIFEYQSMLCNLLDMEVANASMYDGGSALAEAALLACGHTRRKKIVVSSTINPNYLEIIKTYCHGRGINIVVIPRENGLINYKKLADTVDSDTAGVIFQHPNYLGYLEKVKEFHHAAQKAGALLISSNDPISLSVLQPPGEYGVDIATGEGQALGNPLNFGGPYLGIFASTKKLVRKIPGRLVGQTVDEDGQRGFVLTLQTREQHIRREKATSNICTNQGLNALAATVYMSLMGKEGLTAVAELCTRKSHYLADKIAELDNFGIKFDNPFFKEFVVQSTHPVDEVLEKLRDNGIFAGIPLGDYDDQLTDCFLCAVTEKRTKKEMDDFVQALKELF